MRIIKFSQLSQEQLNILINQHYNHWSKFSSFMDIKNTEFKFKTLYTKNTLPFGIALEDNNQIVGFMVLKAENLKKYPNITPWFSNLLIFEGHRNKGYGKYLLSEGEKIFKQLGYNKVYLWTDQAPNYYKKLGYTYLYKVEKNEGGFGDLFCKDI